MRPSCERRLEGRRGAPTSCSVRVFSPGFLATLKGQAHVRRVDQAAIGSFCSRHFNSG
jgi:hypothetical protein